jgi:ABC-type spermidine/putrescine transport system permease subunit II
LDAVLGVLGRAFVVLVVVVLLAPIVLTVVLSFSNDPSVRFPQQTWGVDRYVELFGSSAWGRSFLLSVRLGLASAAIALVVSLLALFAITRSRLRWRTWLEQASLVPLLIPATANAIALYAVFAELGLLGTFTGVALAHATGAVPFVMIIGGIAFRSLPAELELVAITMGASRLRAWVGITLRLALPSLVGGFVMAFLSSFEEAVLINFLGGARMITLPKRILDSLQWGSEPVITAIATLTVVVVSLAIALPLALRRGKNG